MTFDPTKPVQTRDGRKARIICTDAVGDRPVVALVMEGGDEFMRRCFESGSFTGGGLCSADLINIPEEPKTIEGWVNVYSDGSTGNVRAKCDADRVAEVGGRIACVPVTITYREGEGLEDE